MISSDAHWLFKSPVFTAALLASYLSFVKVIGPKMMANRKPFSLKYPILAYNLIVVGLNLHILWIFYRTYSSYSFFGIGYFWNHSCRPLDLCLMDTLCAQGMYKYYLLKIVDLVDTVFFVLRKKQSQLTFLHLFHHSSMLLSVYFCLFFMKEEEVGWFFACINSFVHVIMYFYYFLSALGPKVRKHLWWKKYLTLLQMAQFIAITAILLRTTFGDCRVNVVFQYLWTFLMFSNLTLFASFYRKSYTM